LREEIQVMEPTKKRPKKKAKTSIFGEGQPAGPAAKTVPAVKFTSSRDEEELVDYEPEEPAAFSPI
jgi:hypothetical protein